MRKLSYSDAGVSGFLEAFKISVFGMVRSHHNSRPKQLGNGECKAACHL